MARSKLCTDRVRRPHLFRHALAVALVSAAATLGGCAEHLPPVLPVQTSQPAAADNHGCRQWCVPDGHPASNLAPVYADTDAPHPGQPAAGVELNQEFTFGGTTSRYHAFTRGVDFSKPVGLVVRLPGDGEEEFAEPDGITACLAAVAAAHNKVYVVAETPDREEPVTWWEDVDTNQAWLDGLVHHEVLGKYHASVDDVWFMGYSGGAELLTYGVLAYHPDWVTQGAIMVSGGGSPGQLFAAPTESQLENMDLTWVSGQADTGAETDGFSGLDQAQAGSAFYREQGFLRVTQLWVDGADHFSLPDPLILAQKLAGEPLQIEPLPGEPDEVER